MILLYIIIYYNVLYDLIFIFDLNINQQDFNLYKNKYIIECLFKYFYLTYIVVYKNRFFSGRFIYQSLILYFFWFISPAVVHYFYINLYTPAHEFLLYEPDIVNTCMKLSENSRELDQLKVLIDHVNYKQEIFLLKRKVKFLLFIILKFILIYYYKLYNEKNKNSL